MATDKEIINVWNDLVRIYGDDLPDLEHCPNEFAYRLKLYYYERYLNEFNKTVMQKFSSRQSYTFIKGQYVPIVMNNISDESVQELDKRKFYNQSYDFTMLGYLIDENEFEVKPAIQRVMTVMEIEEPLRKRPKIENTNPRSFDGKFLFVVGNNTLTDVMDYKVDMELDYTTNVTSFDVYINGDFYGTDVNKILINTNDTFTINVVKDNSSKDAVVNFMNKLV